MSRTDDLLDIHQVASLYAHLIDNQLWDRIGDVYAEDATYHSPRGEGVGLAGIVAYLSGNPQPLTHHTTNVHVVLSDDGNEARGVAKYLCVRPDLSVTAGDYEDHWVRTPAGWRLQHRRSTSRTDAAVPTA